jgi:transposase
MMTITTIGFDTSKSWFQIHGVDETGQTVLRRKLARGKVLAFFANLPPCLIGLEACGGLIIGRASSSSLVLTPS